MGIPLCAIYCFSLAAFNICSLCLLFVNLINMCLGVFRLGFILFGTLWVSWTWVIISFPFREVFNYYLLKYFLMVFLFVFFFWDPYDSNVVALHWSLRKAFLSLLAILRNSAFKWVYLSFSPLPLASLLFSAICKAPSNNHFAFCISFSWEWSWSLPLVQCHEPLSIVLQALCLSDLILWIHFLLLLYNCKGFICPSSHLNSKLLSHIFFISLLYDRHSKVCIIEDVDEMMGVVMIMTEINHFFSNLHFAVGLGRTLTPPLESASVSFSNS